VQEAGCRRRRAACSATKRGLVAQEVAAVRVANIPDKIEPYLILAACAVVLGQAEEAQLTTHSSASGHSWSSRPVASRGRLTKCSDARCRGLSAQLHEARNVGNSGSCRMSAITRWRVVSSSSRNASSQTASWPRPPQAQADEEHSSSAAASAVHWATRTLPLRAGTRLTTDRPPWPSFAKSVSIVSAPYFRDRAGA
jgi:hypothetical protein